MSAEVPFAGALPDPEYREPPQAVTEAIRRHRAEHGKRLRLRADVAWPGNPRRHARITLEPASAYRAARFWCTDCGRLTVVGEPESGPERASWLRRAHPELGVLLHGTDPERLDALTLAWDRGDLVAHTVEAPLRHRAQQTKRRQDVAAQERKRRCQEWMLDRYAEIGHVETLLEELERQLSDDVGARAELAAGRAVGYETLRRYWRHIAGEEREAAKRRFEALPEPERRRRTAARYRQSTG